MPTEPKRSIGHIAHDSELCSGCRTCMAICSLSHSGGAVSPELSAIQVVYFPREGSLVEANVCKHCEDAECVYICPVGAIYIDETTGGSVIDPTKCIGCKMCVWACPYKVSSATHCYGDGLSPIRYSAEKEVCFKCDLCNGDPLCVKFCPVKALSLSITKEA